MTYEAQRLEICQVGKLLYDRGYVVSNDGNLSLRVAPDRLLVTPSGVGKGRMTPDMLVVTDLEGNVLEGDRHPSSETKMHLEVYRCRPDVQAVVHAHPPVSTAFAVCRQGLETPYLAETVVGLGSVPCTPSFAMLSTYALPSTPEVPQSILPFVPGHNGVLLANHGALTWGADLWQAFDRMETVEHTAKIFLNAHRIGGAVGLSGRDVQRLHDLEDLYRTLREKTK